jgi:hypothetical protein
MTSLQCAVKVESVERDELEEGITVVSKPQSTRRQLVQGAAAGAAGYAALGTTSSAAAAAGDRDSVVGTWDVAVTNEPPGFGPSEALLTYTEGGVFMTPSNNDPGICIGNWRRTADGMVAATGVCWLFDGLQDSAFGALQYKVIISVTATVAAGALDGRFSVKGLSPSGTPLFTGKGTVHGRRLRIEPVR